MLGFEEALKRNNDKPGHILEFGVASGNTFVQIMKKIKQTHIKLIGFDSWEGLPEEAEGVWRHPEHQKGEHNRSKKELEERMKAEGVYYYHNWATVKGFYEESLRSPQALEWRSRIENLIYVNIDCDLYISCKQILEYIKPVLKIGTCLYFDDWQSPFHKGPADELWGEHRAWKEFEKENPNVAGEWTVGSNNERRVFLTSL